MECSVLHAFLDGELSEDQQAAFERHLAGCASCQSDALAALQLYALGAQLAQRPDRPRAKLTREPTARIQAAPRRWNLRLLGIAVAVSAVLAVVLFSRSTPALDDQITADLLPRRTMAERLPYAALDRYREYDTTRAGPIQGREPATTMSAASPQRQGREEQIALDALARLEKRGDPTTLVAALLARGDLATAEQRLQNAGPGDDLDVERALLAQRRRQYTVALGLLDQVLARTPRHAQASWNRALVLSDLQLPLASAEAFDAAAALSEPGWSREAAATRDDLRHREAERRERLKAVVKACGALAQGVQPDLDMVRRSAPICRPGLYAAVHRAATRDAVMALLPVAQAIDAGSGDTASSELVKRAGSADFAIRGPTVLRYREAMTRRDLTDHDKARLLHQLRASRQDDLVLGALIAMTTPLADRIDELARLARNSRDPYFEELATEYEARAQQQSGHPLEAELLLRESVKRCATRDVELRCAYLHQALIELYLARHRPSEATDAALIALARSRRVGLYWDERFLFDALADAARLARDYSQMRAYIGEATLRRDECFQHRLGQEAISSAELAELRFASARAELDRAPICDEPITLDRVQIEAELAAFDGTPERTAATRRELDRKLDDPRLTRGEQARLDAIEGRLLAASDPAAARSKAQGAITAADRLALDDVDGAKARNHAYRTLLMLGARDLAPAALLDLFAAAGRAPPRPGCALGALIDGERLLLIARDPSGELQQLFEPHAFKTPDFDARTVVPTTLVRALAGCARVDVIALPPLYGQPRLLPSELAWSYRGPAGAPLPTGPAGRGRPVMLTIEDAHPPAELDLPRLVGVSQEPSDPAVDRRILSGAEATPSRVRSQLPAADLVEIHAHGFVDLGISDVSLVALSPDVDGSFALTARVIAGLPLKRAPFIALAACHAAYTAPYLHEPWSLPYAFLLAGARGVFAPATAIPDRDAGNFFRAVGDQILHGADPATVLRDQRLSRRGGATDWVNDVVLFD